MIRILNHDYMCGFHMSFENGWTISVQIGRHNYCSNKDVFHNLDIKPECGNAEIAAWDRNNIFYRFETDDVKGYVMPDEIAKFIWMVSGFKGDANAVNSVQEVTKS